MTNELLKSIDTLIEQKTFSLDALEGIKEIREKATRLENLNKELEAKYKAVQVERDVAKNELNIAITNLEKWAKREEELSIREKEANAAIYNAEKYKAVSETYKDVMNVVFRPNAVRETIQRSVPVTMQSGCNGSYSSYISAHMETENVTREEC